MSKNIQPVIPVTSVSVSSLEQVGRNKKPKRKESRVRLPTPPPDPNAVQDDTETSKKPVAGATSSEKQDEFFEYLDNLQKSPHPNLTRMNSLFTPVIATEDAFDHLEKLYKLMEQMLLLREQNAKLHRRVRDLEHFRNLQNIEKYIETASNAEVNDIDTVFAENLLDTILTETKRDPKPKSAHQFRFRQSILRKQRNSNSLSLDNKYLDMERLEDSYRNASLSTGADKKVSKWTKVKAAFRWERASQTVSDAASKSHENTLGGMQPVNCEVARYLRVPSTSDEPGVSPTDSVVFEIPTPGTISPASSGEDVFCQGRHGIREDSTDDDQSFTLEYIPNSKDESTNLQKSPTGKGPRTTWAKMKDIIQTRNSIKKRNRLSAKSDDFKSDDLICSDEDVFESKESKSPVSFTKNGSEKYSSLDESSQVPLDIIDRYREVSMEDNIFRNGSDSISKWAKVKRAFLSTPSISRVDNCSPSSAYSEGHCIREDQEPSQKSENGNKLQDEIQKNYRDLQTKLSLEFQEKMKEWERMKLSSTTSATSSSTATGSALSPEDLKEQAFKKKMEEWEKIKGQPRHNMQLQSEEHLPLEFRKKLQEWQKIKKGVAKDDSSSNNSSQKKKLGEWPKWKSVSGHRTDISPVEPAPLSDDFIKKLEAWKQMKANSYMGNEEDVKGNKTPSPKLTRKDGGSSRQSKKIKEQTEKELQWFEKELGKIEREKQRLERERQKFLEREERLTKLRRSVMCDNKQNILVQTPSGFYRFEGISRKFTQKLYEWEKAQGIAPEASTFALLNNCYVPTINCSNKHEPQPRLIKSKSADSIMNSEINLTHPLLSQQPSSLSLNDMDNLENEVMLDNAMTSVPDILEVSENIDLDEPEAIIVEVEDIIEETAAPLVPFINRKHIMPVYQKQMGSCMCEGETKAAPTVQRSESTRAQNNYNLIEDIIDLLRLLTENENDIWNREINNLINTKEDYTTECLRNLYSLQVDLSSRLVEKLVRLQEANTKVTANISREEAEYTTNRFVEVLDNVQDLSIDLLQLAEKLYTELVNRAKIETISFSSREKYPSIMYMLQQQNAKILELRRVLSYLCAASDSTAPGKKKKIQRNGRILLRKSSSKEKDRLKRSLSKENSTPRNSPLSKEDPESDEDIINQIAQGAIKKRYRYRQKSTNNRVVDESDEDDSRLQKKAKKKSQSTTNTGNINIELHTELPKALMEEANCVNFDPNVIQKVAVPTKLNFVITSEPVSIEMTASPVQVFVKTTRKLFTPLIMSSFATESRKLEVLASPTVVSVPSFRNLSKETNGVKVDQNKPQSIQGPNTITHLPPLPASPTTQRKMNKEISPNIRLMLARYNQKIHEQESPGCKSGGSSGSSSPVAWRSPINERRVKAQTQKYQQELMKLSPKQVQKSASLGFMNNKLTFVESPTNPEKTYSSTKGILKSSSACALTARVRSEQSVTISENSQPRIKGGSLKLMIPDEITQRLHNDSRSIKLQRAKEEFLNAPVCPMSAPPIATDEKENPVKYPERNRLSQISVGSESSYDSSAYEGMLMKSASAGMINVDPETYRQIDPEIHGGGYVSLPRASKKRKEGLMSNIASKFRKVKMRRNKDPNKMNTISTLCRQSLIVDINTAGSDETLTAEQAEASRKDSLSVPSDSKGSSSADTSPSTSRSGSWIRTPRLFKPKQ